MAQNDYHVIVYRILAYLYAQLKEGKAVDADVISHSGYLCDINYSYWLYIMKSLLEQDYIRGIKVIEKNDLEPKIIGLKDCFITPKGIEYICDDNMIEKAKAFANGKDVSNLI